MEIFPAIDLRSSKVVRLTQGDYDRMEVYSSNPTETAKLFKQQGASNLHVVDLDGAKDGRLSNFDTIQSIVKEADLFIQVGGGIRDENRVSQYLEIGVSRVILGTVAVSNFSFMEKMVRKYGNKIAVGVDAKEGYVAVHGWKEVSNLESVGFCKRLADIGVSTIIYTDISKDGAMQGTNLEIYRTLNQIEGVNIIASGGISFENEITELVKMHTYGAIVGKAIYTKTLDLKKVISLAKEN